MIKYIWTLRRTADTNNGRTPYWDEATDMVVIAQTAKLAREVAANNCADEGREVWLNGRRSGKPFARIKKIGMAKRNDNGSVKQDQVVVRDGVWTG